MRDRAPEPAPRRRGARSGGALVSARAAERRRGDARALVTYWCRRGCTTLRSSTAAATAPIASSRTCAEKATGSRRRRSGRRRAPGIPAEDLRALARRMAASRTLVTVSYSLQRAEHGEQPVWAGARARRAPRARSGSRAAASGTATDRWATSAARARRSRCRYLPEGRNPVQRFIPVARIADLLLRPGESFDYDGARHVYPDIRLVYWAGGNPFHHHQDLNRLRRALGRPDTVIVHEPYWTPMARHADLVFPATTSFERNDIGSGRADARIIAMHRAARAFGEARNDHDILTALAERFGVAEAFTEGRDERAWLERPVREDPGSARRRRASPPRPSTSSGRRARSRFPTATPSVCSSTRSARIQRATGCGRRAAGSSSSPRPSRASATTTVRGIRPGWRRRRRSARRVRRASRSRSSRTTPRRGCTASSISATTARRRRCRGASPCGCIRRTPRHAASPAATSCGSATTAEAASPAPS